MLRSVNSGPPAKPDIQCAIAAILKEDASFDRSENRSAHRDNLVRAVTVESRESEEVIHCFSRNVSATGIGLISNEKITEKMVGTLTIDSLSGTPTVILSECRWCRPYGDNWFLSGWQFIKLKRN